MRDETYYQQLLSRWSKGERITRGEKKDLEMYIRVKSLEELEHICEAMTTAAGEVSPHARNAGDS